MRKQIVVRGKTVICKLQRECYQASQFFLKIMPLTGGKWGENYLICENEHSTEILPEVSQLLVIIGVQFQLLLDYTL